jgi:mannitol-1-phosphate 5-dehydrogenase
MTKEKLIIHFGAGALGRGFIVPILIDSGCKVILVDANEDLVNKLKETLSYTLFIADEEEGKQTKTIHIDGVLSVISDAEELKNALKKVTTVTTSVRQENLVHVAKFIGEAWNDESNDERAVICCENLENASCYFKSLLADCAKDEKHKKMLEKIKVPDTMVDRGCSQSKSDPMVVFTESFYEIGVDKNMLPDTGIKLIPAVDDFQQHFYRKRFLVNTFADASAFMGIYYGLDNMEDILYNKDIKKELEPYFTLVKKSLEVGFGMSEEEVEKWYKFYWFERRKNDTSKTAASQRKADDVARDMWRKLNYEERFIKPLAILKSNGYDINSGLGIIAKMVKFLADKETISNQELLKRIEQMWCRDEAGKYIYGELSKLINI